MIKVSVILPVYNSEEFLGECLDSLVNQTLTNLEIICINDGSTDNSLNILNNYAKKDQRIKIITQKNQGHAVATNKGIDIATGECLYLMDSDDIIALSALEETYNYMKEKQADFVIFQTMNYEQDTGLTYKSKIYSMDNVADAIGDTTVNYKELGINIFRISVTPWSKLYNTEFIKRIGAKFPERLIFDDNVFFWEVLFNAERIAFYRKYLFTRRWYSYSSTNEGDERFMDSLKISNLILDKFKEYDEFENYKDILYNRKVDLTYLRFSRIKKEYKQEFFERLNEDYQNVVDNDLYYDYMDVLNDRNKIIFNSCLNAKNWSDFRLKVQNFDEKETNKYKKIKNIISKKIKKLI